MSSRLAIRRALAVCAVLAAAALAASAPASAGELAVTWAAVGDAMTAGYEVELLDAEGRVLRVLDVEEKTSVNLEGLDDGTRYGVRVRPYDEHGNKARRASASIVTLPAPRVDGASTTPLGDGLAVVALTGANFDENAHLVPRMAGLEVLEVTVPSHTRLEATVRFDGNELAVAPDRLLVVNPVRKGMSYVAAHPEVVDVDRSGEVDLRDVAMLEGLFGITRDDPRYRAEFDPNDDGVIDGEDRELVKALIGGTKRGRAH